MGDLVCGGDGGREHCPRHGQRALEGYGLVGQARVEAAQGREEECRAHIDRALAITGNSDTDYLYIYTVYARGLLELGLGRADAAYTQLWHP